MQEKTCAEWMAIFVADGGIVAHPYQTSVTALDDPDIIENGHVTTIGNVRQLGPLANLTRTPAEPGALKVASGAFLPCTNPDSANDAPLAGLIVLEMATIIAAPLGASFLADLGARVIKVEPVGGDPFRSMGLWVWRCNQGKEAIGVDLKSAAGRRVVKLLADKADIVIHNYRPGVPERLGIDYKTLSADNPQLIYVSANGYGPAGPGAKRPSTHPIPGAALGGAKHQAGSIPETPLDLAGIREGARRLMRANEVNPDPNTSMVVSATAMLGLMARESTGVGQQIFVDMFGANAYANFDDFLSYPGKPPRAVLDDELRGTGSTHRLYPCASGWVFLSISNRQAWQSFADLADAPGLASAFEPSPRTHNPKLSVALEKLFATRNATDWQTRMAPAGLGCVVADAGTTFEYFFSHARPGSRLMVPVEQEDLGAYYRHGAMIDFDRSPTPLKAAARGGSHTRKLCRELGYTDAQIDVFYAAGTLWSAPPPVAVA